VDRRSPGPAAVSDDKDMFRTVCKCISEAENRSGDPGVSSSIDDRTGRDTLGVESGSLAGDAVREFPVGGRERDRVEVVAERFAVVR